MGRIIVWAAGLAVSTGVCALAHADRMPAAWLLLDRQLKPTPVGSVTSITADEVRFVGTDTSEQVRPRAAVLALVPSSWTNAPASHAWSELPGMLESVDRGPGLGQLTLVDGTRVPGSVDAAGTRAEVIAWDHPVFGRFTAPLDQVRRVQMPPPVRSDDDETGAPARAVASPPSAPGTNDRLVLVNGDVVTGLVSGFVAGTGQGRGACAASVETLPGADGARQPARTITLDRVQTIDLVNPAGAPSGVIAWLEEGSVLAGASISMTGPQMVSLELPAGRRAGGPIKLGLVHLRAIALDAAHVRPLADLTMHAPTAVAPLAEPAQVTVEGAGATPVALGAASVTLSGPVSVTFDLPAGASRFSGRLVLPEASRVWGDCVVVFSAGGKRMLSHHLNAQAPDLDFNVPVSGSTLEVRLEPGERGAIQDAAVIQRGLVAVE